jgi:hypothetical protein
MNHQLYKDWLLTAENLTPEQQASLQDHLHTCADCRQVSNAWESVESLFTQTPQAEPVPGFTTRWQVRVLERRQSQQKRQAWVAMGFLAILALGMASVLGAAAVNLLSSPGELTLAIISRLSQIYTLISALDALLPISSVRISPLLSITLAIFTTGMISLLSVLWLAMIQHLILNRRTNL